jgi:PAS domain S-box-containing protein
VSRPKVTPTGRAAAFHDHEIIVSKTDLRGVITYANDVFCRVAGYHEREVLGQPHNVIRHPDMPRCVFRLLWDTVQAKREIFAYVLNLARNGDHYWVLAHVTPSYDTAGNHVGYHSNRRVPHADALARVQSLYDQLLAAERAQATPEAALKASTALLQQTLAAAGVDYSQFVFGLSAHTQVGGKR